MGAQGYLGRDEPASAIQVALLILIAVFIIYYMARFLGILGKSREGFASKQAHEVHDKAHEVFRDGGGDARYTDYKSNVPGADPVQYNDVRTLYKQGSLTPGAVQQVI